MMKKLLLLAFILIPCLAQAEVIRVGITWASNRYSLSRSGAIKAYRMAAKSLRQETNAKLRLVSFQPSRDISRRFGSGPGALTVPIRHDRLDLWQIHYGDRQDWKFLRLIIVPPINNTWTAGIANGICTFGRKNPMAQVSVRKNNVLFAAAAIQHELGHALGAWHDEQLPATAMNPNSIFYASEKKELLNFSNSSIQEINACIS